MLQNALVNVSNGRLEPDFSFFLYVRVNVNKVNVKVNVHKVNVEVNVDKANVKVNVKKVNDKLNDIYSIHNHYKGGGRWPPPHKR